MINIFLTGSSGFIGSNFIKYFDKEFLITKFNRIQDPIIKEKVVIHLAGKAHDLKGASNYNDYFEANTKLTIKLFDAFLNSDSEIFIMLSSVKAVADNDVDNLTESIIPNPISLYGKTKLLAEDYILSKELPINKKVFILRPCMVHGPGNKGNLNLLSKFIDYRIPWPLASYENLRSFCSLQNLLFIIRELIVNNTIESGVYNIADSQPISTNDLIKIISNVKKRNVLLVNVPKILIKYFIKIISIFNSNINDEFLNKLTTNYVVSNRKIVNAIGKDLPVSTIAGLTYTLESFKNQ
jgi:nucleoside-diphosphate-sugar epimerase